MFGRIMDILEVGIDIDGLLVVWFLYIIMRRECLFVLYVGCRQSGSVFLLEVDCTIMQPLS